MELINQDILRTSVAELTKIDADLDRIVDEYGIPPLWDREPGFATLVHIILEQQVSLASALAAFRKLQAAIGLITAENFLTLDSTELKRIGFSRQKSDYCRNLADMVVRGELKIDELTRMSDEDVRATLITVRGIGHWTIDIYLLMALSRKDIWPNGDLALINALKGVKGLAGNPDQQEIEKITDAWRPWRSIAARILWHYYLSR